MAVAGVFGPYISSVLTARDLRLPYIASACVCALNLCIVATIDETLPLAERRAFTWSGCSPLAVLELFRNGTQIGRLSAMTIIDTFVQGFKGANGVVRIHQMQVLEWDVLQRGRFQSIEGVLRSTSFALPKRLINMVGFVPAVRLGFVSFIAEHVGCAFCLTPLGFYVMAAVGVLHPSATSSIAGMLTGKLLSRTL
jgi:hypothetical protein